MNPGRPLMLPLWTTSSCCSLAPPAPSSVRRSPRTSGSQLGRSEMLRFPRATCSCGCWRTSAVGDVFLVQGTAFPANDNFVELLFWIDAFKRASAASVTAVIPYFSYAKGDKKDEPRVSIRARVCADAIEAAGADRVVTLDLHAPQVQGFFHIPVDDLYAMPDPVQRHPGQGARRHRGGRAGCRGSQAGAAMGRPAQRTDGDRGQAAGGPYRDGRGGRAHRLRRGSDRADRG